MGRPRLTLAQRTLLDFIITFKRAHDGCAPTVREICEALHLSTTSSVRLHLDALERHGLIRCGAKSQARMIEVIGATWTPPLGTPPAEGGAP